MQINLTDILFQDKEYEKKEFVLPITEVEFGSEHGEIQDGIKITIEFQKTGKNKMILKGLVETVLVLPCNRCNERTMVPLKSEFYKEVEPGSTEDDEDSFIENNVLDIEKLAFNEIFLNFPMKILCKEDCKGFCVECGCNLNLQDCKCEEDPVDIRLAGMKELFDKNFKEV